ncbi:MAG: DUF6091 family protein [Moraxellaceae bacterium]|nr:DUF6091 family protein [Moraxellaceae bacterium]
MPLPIFLRASLRRCLLATVLLLPVVASAQTLCVWDPLGAQGDAYGMMRDLAVQARSWGGNITLKAYTDERIAAEDFKAGQCDGALMTGLRARQFNKFAGSIDSVGAIPGYSHLRDVIDLLADPRLGNSLITGPYEVAGVVPIGAGYFFVNDRRINNISKAAGKKIAVFDWDKSQEEMVRMVGAQPVAADVTTFAGKFNNGQVDIVVAPIYAYQAMELYKGLSRSGGIARYPVIQITLQLVIRKDAFPAGFGLKSREYVARQVPRFFSLIRNTEYGVDAKYWMNVPLSDRGGYADIMRELRTHLTKAGYYDPRMMALLKRVRCKREPADAECAIKD